jgi:hypothetical protein
MVWQSLSLFAEITGQMDAPEFPFGICCGAALPSIFVADVTSFGNCVSSSEAHFARGLVGTTIRGKAVEKSHMKLYIIL